MIRRVAWPVALMRLQSVIPKAGSFSADELADLLIQGRFLIPLPDWEQRSDSEILSLLISDIPTNNKLLVVTESSYVNGVGAFEVNGGDLDKFIADHVEEFGEAVVNGDVIVVCEDAKCVSLFHHEGYFLTKAQCERS